MCTRNELEHSSCPPCSGPSRHICHVGGRADVPLTPEGAGGGAFLEVLNSFEPLLLLLLLFLLLCGNVCFKRNGSCHVAPQGGSLG